MSTLLGANPLEFVTKESSLLDLDSVNISTESTYLSETLKFIQECNKEFNEANKEWYKAILESGNDQVVITESFHDFFVKVKGIIDKFIAYIKSLAERFITNIMSIGKSDNYLKKHRDDLKKFNNSKDQFEFDGYEFTFNPAVPVCEMLQVGFTKEFVELKMNNDGSIVDAESAAVGMKKIYDDLIKKLENGFYDQFRRDVLAISYEISQSDFSNECFSAFRNNTSDKDSITINSAYIESAYARFINYSDMKKHVDDIKKRITKEYEGVKKQILEISKTSYTGKTTSTDINLPETGQLTALKLDGDVLKYLDLYIKAKADQVQEMSNIHAIAFACKLDAMKASYVQDKTVLYKALSKCQRVHSEANYTDYTKELEYASFLMESLESQKNMERYIQECYILSEGVNVTERLQALNEGKLSDNFKKFINWIKGIIAKFSEKLTAFAAKDTTYLEKYKDIILGKKFKDVPYNMPDYFTGMKRISQTGVPQFNYITQEKLLAGENGEFAKSIIKEYDPAKYESFSDFCKFYFQGSNEPKDFSGAEIGANIRDIYDFCYDFKKIQNQIKNDQNTIERAARSAEDVLTKASKDNEASRAATATAESYTYSAVYDMYLTEEDVADKFKFRSPDGKPTGSDDKTSKDSAGYDAGDHKLKIGKPDTQNNDSKKLSDNINNVSDKDKDVNNDSEEAKAKAAEQEIKQITDNVKRYTDVCGSLLTAKLTIIERMRSDFMKIIRYHVESYVGKADDKGDNRGTAPTGTDYRSDDKKKAPEDGKGDK